MGHCSIRKSPCLACGSCGLEERGWLGAGYNSLLRQRAKEGNSPVDDPAALRTKEHRLRIRAGGAPRAQVNDFELSASCAEQDTFGCLLHLGVKAARGERGDVGSGARMHRATAQLGVR